MASAWSSTVDSKLVAAAGTFANLAAALVSWLALHFAKRASVRTRYSLVVTLAFNLLNGTGYFFFSGVTNFGDWAAVISGWPMQGLLRALLIVFGIAALSVISEFRVPTYCAFADSLSFLIFP